jgi:MSHA biogenesis protein MshO
VVQAIAGKLVTMASNPFALQDPKLAHPLHRFLVVGQPVTYRCAGGKLYRHSGYGFNVAQDEDPENNPVLLASNVDSCVFSYTQVGQTRTALVSLTLVLKRPTGNDGTVTLTQQIHVDNTP